MVLWLRLPVAGLLMMAVWAMIYYVLPDVEQKFKFITPGSVVGVLLWLLASAGFSMYVKNFGSYDVSYGALGGVIVMLMWMWISAQVILIGAEINAILEHKSPEGKVSGREDGGGERAQHDQGRAAARGAGRGAGPAQPASAPAAAPALGAAARGGDVGGGLRPGRFPPAPLPALRPWPRALGPQPARTE